MCACVLCIVYCVYCVFASYHQSDVQSSINPSHPSTLTSWVHKAPKHFMLLLPFSTTCLDLEVGIPSSTSCLLSWPEWINVLHDFIFCISMSIIFFQSQRSLGYIWGLCVTQARSQHRGFLTPKYNLLRESTPPTLQIPLTVLDPAGRWTTFISDRAFETWSVSCGCTTLAKFWEPYSKKAWQCRINSFSRAPWMCSNWIHLLWCLRSLHLSNHIHKISRKPESEPETHFP